MRLLVLLFPLLVVSLQVKAETVNYQCGENGDLLNYHYEDAEVIQPTTDDIEVLKQQAQSYCDEFGDCFESTLGTNAASSLQDILSIVDTSYHDFAKELKGEWERVFKNKDTRLAKMNELSQLQSELLDMRSVLEKCKLYEAIINRGPDATIGMNYPFKGPNSSKTSSAYLKDDIEKIIRTSIMNGVDPYMALSIAIMENPPVDNQSYQNYYQDYGMIPIDGLPAYDMLGCFQRRSRRFSELDYATREQRIQYRELKSKSDQAGETFDYWVEQSPVFNENKGFASAIGLIFDSDIVDQFLKGNCDPKQINPRDYFYEGPATDFCQPDFIKAVQLFKVYEDEKNNLNTFMESLSADPLQRKLITRELECEKGCVGFLIPQRPERIPTFEVITDNSPTKTAFMCDNNGRGTVGHGARSSFTYARQADPARCCVNLIVSESVNEFSLASEFKAAMAANYLSRYVQRPMETGRDKDLAHAIQRFNGLGCYGCSEQMPNSCFEGINMDKQPLYGARTADLMMNMVMNDDDIQKMVLKVSMEAGKPVKSSLCYTSGSGSHAIESKKFYQQQYEILMHPRRANHCSKYFK